MFWLTSLFQLLYLCRLLQNNYSEDASRVRWRVHYFELLYFLYNRLFTVYLRFTVYLFTGLLFTGCLRDYEVISPITFVSVGMTYVVRKKTLFWEIHMGFEQKEKLPRDADLNLMKYRWAISKSTQAVPIKANEFKIEITLVIWNLGDQLDINEKLRHLVILLCFYLGF